MYTFCIERGCILIMNNDEELFDNDMMNYIIQFVESKEDVLKNIKDFKEKDKMLSLSLEVLENELSKDNKEKLDKVIKTMYQIEEYYITLAYMLGTKYGKNIESI